MTKERESAGVRHPKVPRKSNPESSNIILYIDPGKTLVSQCPHRESEGIYLEKTEISAAAEERRRTGRYLAVGLTLVMVFIACYHILMRQMPVLVGLLAPAIIMILYVLWLLYFAKKRRRTEITLV